MTDNITGEIINRIKTNTKRISVLERSDSFSVIQKSTTGNPATGKLGEILINTFDNKAFIYADSDWREIASW